MALLVHELFLPSLSSHSLPSDKSWGSWWQERGLAYAQLARIDKPIGTLLLLWPTLWALSRSRGWWTAGTLDPDRVRGGVFLMRSAGCVINDYADRSFDGHQIARRRPLPGRDEREVLVLFAVLALLSFALVLTLNPLTISLSFAGLLLAVCYPFMKRSPIPSWCSDGLLLVHSHGLRGPGNARRRKPGCCFLPEPAVDHRL